MAYYVDEMGAARCCEIGATKFGRGLVATKDLAPGQTILKIPLSCSIMVEKWDDNKATDNHDDAWAGQLAVKLLEESTRPSPYADALPPPPSTPVRGDWSISALNALDNAEFLNEIQDAKEWRNRQCEDFVRGRLSGAIATTPVEPHAFLDTLDLVSSRTIRCGNKFMLVPFLDMANHASRDQGGGYYELDMSSNGDVADHIVLKAGDRGVAQGNEICLDYGSRRNEEWLIHYGFLPDRNTAESVVLPDSKRTITWSDVNASDEELQKECRNVLEGFDTSLADDIASLRQIETMAERDWDLEMSLQYRIARKTLLTAVGGVRTASAFSSAFYNAIEEEPSAVSV
ncbi:MAG: hypothetical protein SGILL_002016 [Bacillariaceae sp.]